MINIAELPKYDVYKDSGNEWLGVIPKDWAFKKFKYLARVKKGKIPKRIVSVDSFNLPPYLSMDYLRGTDAKQFVDDRSAVLVENGAILLLWDGSNAGEFVLGKWGVVSSTLAHVDFFSVNKKFAWYACQLTEMELRSTTVGMGIPHVDGEQLKNSILAIPSPNEQVLIANFLHKKTTQIDEAIAIKEQQISLLKERNQIVIQQAMIQGLDTNVPMKDSGIDWIGNIPEHWEVVKLKHLFSENTQRTKTGNEILFSLRMELGLVPHDDVSDKPIPAENLVDYKIVKSGQLVMNRMRASIGIFGLASDFGLVSPDYAVFDVAETVRADYYLALFKMPLMWTQFRLASKGMGTGSSGFMRLYTDEFGDIKVAKPPKQEQESLMQFIEKTNISTAAGVEHIQFQIEKLKEYKTSLINSAVTGKIKITPEMIEQ